MAAVTSAGPLQPLAIEPSDPGAHPRPQLRRAGFTSLDGEWSFAFDDEDRGLQERWSERLPAGPGAGRVIVVPFPPESAASGIRDPAYHPVCWYSRELEVPPQATGSRVLLHLGAVDFRAQVWLGGRYLGGHEGGSTPFSFDVTPEMSRGADPVTLVVRVEDDPRDVAQPRGKQDWRQEPHGIWYRRTTGIWQPVWLEVLPSLHVQDLSWRPDAERGSVTVGVELNQRPHHPVTVRVRLRFGELMLAEVAFTQSEPRGSATITLPRQSNGQEREWLLWSPEHPRLIDAEVEIVPESGPADLVRSYFGLRSVGWAGGHFLLNDRPYYVRAVLEQAYWPESHLAAPDPGAFESEVRLIKDLGFNTARVHEAVADPRLLYWADRLGLLIWGESASAYEFSTTAVERTTREWTAVVRRDLSHPCIAVWVPLNESWGVQQIAHDPAQLDYARALYHLTKALDPSRPVVSNDGWEHAESDIWTIHDYGITRAELAANYSDAATVAGLLNGIGPLGRRMRLLPASAEAGGNPVMVSEFGGISYNTSAAGESWGYATVDAADDFEALLRELFAGIQSSPVLAGFCYTQLTDTLQEANGLTDADRRPKLPVEVIRSIVAGDAIDTSWHGRPKQPVEQPNGPNEEARQ